MTKRKVRELFNDHMTDERFEILSFQLSKSAHEAVFWTDAVRHWCEPVIAFALCRARSFRMESFHPDRLPDKQVGLERTRLEPIVIGVDGECQLAVDEEGYQGVKLATETMDEFLRRTLRGPYEMQAPGPHKIDE